jgi:hypothetical protein
LHDILRAWLNISTVRNYPLNLSSEFEPLPGELSDSLVFLHREPFASPFKRPSHPHHACLLALPEASHPVPGPDWLPPEREEASAGNRTYTKHGHRVSPVHQLTCFCSLQSAPFNFKKEEICLPGITEDEYVTLSRLHDRFLELMPTLPSRISVLREKAAASCIGIAHDRDPTAFGSLQEPPRIPTRSSSLMMRPHESSMSTTSVATLW